jgi:putative ABC transport system permease protein
VLVTPRLSLSGIITNGSASTIFIGEGVEPRDSKIIQGDFNHKMAGEVREDSPSGIAVAAGLSRILNLQKGGTGALLVNTVNGQANALDVDIVDTFNTGNAGTNDKFVYLPLSLAQKLYDIDGAERLTVLLDDKQYTEDARRFLERRLRQAGFHPEIQTWLEMSSFYKQVKGLFDMIFMFIFSIVLIVVVMSVINSMSMTVLERTREIGTLRAMGLRRRNVVRLFATEALTLVLIGSAAGMTITALVRLAVNSAGITYQPPNSSNVVRLLVDLDPVRIGLTFALMAILGVFAAYLPARNAARRPIIDSLAHV